MYNNKSAFSYLEMIKALLNGEQLESEFCESIEQDKVRNVLKEIENEENPPHSLFSSIVKTLMS